MYYCFAQILVKPLTVHPVVPLDTTESQSSMRGVSDGKLAISEIYVL